MEEKTKIKDENYYQINGFMVNRLKLKGIALMVYAIIYGFSQDGESEFAGSRKYLCDFTGTTKPTIDKALNELIESNLIIKISETKNSITFNRYKVNLDMLDFTTSKETLLGGSKETLPNNNNLDNKDINNKDNNINNKESIKESKSKKPKEKEPEHHFGTYGRIMLTTTEYNKLCDDFTKSYIDEVIEKLDEYVEMNNNKNKYKKFNLVIRKAIRENWSILKGINKVQNDKFKNYKFNEI